MRAFDPPQSPAQDRGPAPCKPSGRALRAFGPQDTAPAAEAAHAQEATDGPMSDQTPTPGTPAPADAAVPVIGGTAASADAEAPATSDAAPATPDAPAPATADAPEPATADSAEPAAPAEQLAPGSAADAKAEQLAPKEEAVAVLEEVNTVKPAAPSEQLAPKADAVLEAVNTVEAVQAVEVAKAEAPAQPKDVPRSAATTEAAVQSEEVTEKLADESSSIAPATATTGTSEGRAQLPGAGLNTAACAALGGASVQPAEVEQLTTSVATPLAAAEPAGMPSSEAVVGAPDGAPQQAKGATEAKGAAEAAEAAAKGPPEQTATEKPSGTLGGPAARAAGAAGSEECCGADEGQVSPTWWRRLLERLPGGRARACLCLS